MRRTEEEWISQYKEKGGLWIHGGHPQAPHAELASKKHSGGFFNSRRVIPDEALLREAADDLLAPLAEAAGPLWPHISAIVGPQTGATRLCELLRDAKNERVTTAERVSGLRYVRWVSASPAKYEDRGVKSMVFTDKQEALIAGKNVAFCEDVITTGGSIELTENAVVQAGGKPMPFVCALVNRSGLSEINGKRIVALINRPMPMWEPQDCPLCKAGSQAIPAKDPENWAKLNASY